MPPATVRQPIMAGSATTNKNAAAALERRQVVLNAIGSGEKTYALLCMNYYITYLFAMLSTDPNELPSTNMLELLERLESSDAGWIKEINAKLGEDEDES